MVHLFTIFDFRSGGHISGEEQDFFYSDFSAYEIGHLIDQLYIDNESLYPAGIYAFTLGGSLSPIPSLTFNSQVTIAHSDKPIYAHEYIGIEWGTFLSFNYNENVSFYVEYSLLNYGDIFEFETRLSEPPYSRSSADTPGRAQLIQASLSLSF